MSERDKADDLKKLIEWVDKAVDQLGGLRREVGIMRREIDQLRKNDPQLDDAMRKRGLMPFEWAARATHQMSPTLQ